MKKLLYTIKKNNYYYRMLVPYLTLSIIVVCITGGMSWNIIGSKYNNQIKETNRHMLAQVQIYADQNLYNNFMTIINDNFLIGYANTSLSNFGSDESNLTHFNYFQFFKDINDICFKNNFVEYITLYSEKSQYLIDSEYGLNMSAKDNRDLLDRYFPFTSYLNIAIGDEKIKFFIPPKRNYSLCASLTMLRSIPLYTTFKNGNGFIAMSINQEKFMDSVKSIYQFDGGLMIVDKDNQLLMKNIPEGMTEFECNTIIQHAIKEGKNKTYKYKGVTYLITLIKSTTSNWSYISFIPINILNAESIATRHIVLMLVILIVLLCIIFSQIIGSKIYKPLKVLRNHISNQPSYEVKDDISAINDALFFLEDQVDDMKQTLTQNKNIILYKILMDILYNHNINEEYICRRLKLCDITFDLPCYCIIIVDIEYTTFYSLTVDQREYITTKSQEFANDWFAKNVIQMTESQPANRIVTVLNLREEQYEQLLQRKKEFLDYMETNLHVRVNIAISNLVNNIGDISKVFITTSNYLRYAFIYNYSNIFTPDIITSLDTTNFELNLNDYGKYKNLLRSGHINEAIGLLKKYKNQIVDGGYSYESINNFLIQIYQITFKVGNELVIFQDEKKKELVVQDFKSTNDVVESFECLFVILNLFNDDYNERHNQADSRLINEIMDYINANSCKELSLVSISEQFKISTSHLSRLFKNITGDNLSVYVINSKLESAANMLLTMPDTNVCDIAKSLGYYTPAYFTKLFKNKYGMTPTQYRKRNII